MVYTSLSYGFMVRAAGIEPAGRRPLSRSPDSPRICDAWIILDGELLDLPIVAVGQELVDRVSMEGHGTDNRLVAFLLDLHGLAHLKGLDFLGGHSTNHRL